ncbi:MAG TPA: ABC transporter permease [Solirubrobacterales bacterium]|jgi:ribose transport system permease protein
MSNLKRLAPRTSIWYATAALFLLSWLIEPGSVSSVSINAMLPFAGILAVAAVGQTLVIMQRGIDLSVPGMITLSGMALSEYSSSHHAGIVVSVLVVLGLAVVVGLINGLVVGYLRVSALVATLAMNAILMGAAIDYSGGSSSRAPAGMNSFSVEKTLGLSNTVWLALALVLVVGVGIAFTVWGRRFVAVGARAEAARAAGIRVEAYRLAAYIAAAVCYAAAGMVLAGYLETPNITMGDTYLLPTIAAVVVGGTALTGGKGHILGTAIGALFLTQLTQLVLSMGAPTSTQLVIQAVVIAAAAALQVADREAILARLRPLRVRMSARI